MTDGSKSQDEGTVYLLHLDPPVKHARHYTGWTSHLDQRLEAHRSGRGARLMEVVKEAGGAFRLVRTWPGPRALERAIKDMHSAPRLCPECSPQPRPLTRGRTAAVGSQREITAATEADVLPQPGPGPVLLTAWPGRSCAPDLYSELMPVTDRLVSGWRAELDRASPAPEVEADLELEPLAAARRTRCQPPFP